MKLAFLHHPVKNIKESLTFYRETLGFEEAWREGDHTVVLRLPGTEVQLMLEDDEFDFGAGGIFVVDSVNDFYEENEDKLNFVKMPCDIPPGRYAIYKDVSGNTIRIIDMSNES